MIAESRLAGAGISPPGLWYTRPAMAVINCMMKAKGLEYPIRLTPYENRAEPAPYKWSADIHRLDLADLLPTLAEGDGVTICNEGRSVEATIVKVYHTALAQIAGKGDPPWPIKKA